MLADQRVRDPATAYSRKRHPDILAELDGLRQFGFDPNLRIRKPEDLLHGASERFREAKRYCCGRRVKFRLNPSDGLPGDTCGRGEFLLADAQPGSDCL
jgi:hypothetical protein